MACAKRVSASLPIGRVERCGSRSAATCHTIWKGSTAMEKMTRRGFIRDAGLVPISGALSWYFGGQREEPPRHATSPLFTEPSLEHRDARHYVAIRTTIAMREMPAVLPQLWKEVYGWLGAQRVAPAGPPLLRFLVIDMPAR